MEHLKGSDKKLISANMIVKQDAKYYKMDHPNRGCAYIFSHQIFEEEKHEPPLGVYEDCKKIRNCLNKLGFKHVVYFSNLKLAEIKYRIHEVVNMDHTDNDCFMLFVLTQGNDDGTLEAMDEAYDPEEVLWNQFTAEKCPTLAGKPKLFFIHARQGSNVDPGIQLVHKPRRTETDGVEEYKIPIQADFLIMYSTARGYHAFHDEKGSHFISVLTEELENGINGKDFLTILTLVNQRVAVEFTSNNVDVEKHNKKQAPYFHCYLMRILQFNVKSRENKEITRNMNIPNTVFHSIHGDTTDGGCIGKPIKDVSDGGNDVVQLKNYRGMPPDNSAWASVNKDDLYYKMDHGNKGIAYIFNHEKFLESKCNPRDGSRVDRKKVEECFRNLGFDVHPFQDLKLSEIRNQIEQAVNMDHTDRDCFALIVLSHGDQDQLHAYDRFYDPNKELWSQFTPDKCPSLAGKPKLFFLQACQGVNLDPGVRMVENKMSFSRTETDGGRLPYSIPVHSDFLIMYPTAKGYFAFRNTANGSHFIKALCEELQKLAYTDHLLNILTMVNQRVAIEFTSTTRDPTYCRKKQIPYFHSSLTRLLQFVKPTKL